MLTVVTPAERVKEALEAHGCPVHGSSARCPAHDDSSPSLSISEGQDGRVLLKCFADCRTEDIVAALDLQMTDLFVKTNGKRPPIARYPYTDEEGKILYHVERYEPGFDGSRKSFAQVPANGRRGKGAMNGVRLVLYRLPAVVDAVARGEPVYVVEGEKDVEALEKVGKVATCNPAGAGKWTKVADAAWQLRDATVIVVADKDLTGLRHARQVVASLRSTAKRIIVAEAEHGKDATDHLQAGFTPDDFAILAGDDCEPSLDDWLGTAEPEAEPEPEAAATDEDDTWKPIDLRPILSGEVTQPVPDVMVRHDGTAIFYEGAVNGIHGDSGAGKGWLVCLAIVQQARRGRRSILIDMEDVATSITARLLTLGMTAEEIVDHLIYIRPQTRADTDIVAELVAMIVDQDIRLVVIDSLGEAFGIEGLDENKDTDVGPWYRRVARKLAEAGPAVVLVDHSTKANDNPLHPSGSKRKRAGITGASFYAEAIEAFVKGRGGRLRLVCAKDRHGNFRRGDLAGYLVMTCSPFGSMRLEMYAPSPTENKVTLPIILAARAAVKAAKKEGRQMSQDALIGSMEIRAGSDTKRAGIDLAVGRGALSESSGPRNARLFEYLSEFPEEES